MKIALAIGGIALVAALAWVGYSAQVTFSLKPETAMTGSANESAITVTPVAAATADGSEDVESKPEEEDPTKQPPEVRGYTHDELLELADTKFANGSVPLGDNRYTTAGAKRGYVYLCNVRKDNPGSMAVGPWMHGTTWNYKEKISIDGSVSWSNAAFSNKVSGTSRNFSGNGLPISHTTGVYPVGSDDDAYKYDRNPNTISTQALSLKLPNDPEFSNTPYCMGGEVGIMLSGVPLFNAFDAGLRDALAHELQDSCDGHPQGSGQYHYHSMSSCFKNENVTSVLGYALDGFPITGSKVGDDTYLTTEDLDECHGIKSEVMSDGKKKMTYHYVLTRDFPYSAGCFRGKPVSLMVIQGAAPTGGQGGMQRPPTETQSVPPAGGTPQGGAGGQPPGGAPQPPAEAMAACSGMTKGASCSFETPDGMQITGHCDTPPGQSSVACVPQ